MASENWVAFDRFARRIPDGFVHLIDPQARAPTEDLREAITWALTFTAMLIIVAVATNFLQGVYNVLAGRELLVRTGRFVAFVRKLLAMAMVFLPWYCVVDLIDTGIFEDDLLAFASMAGVGWMALRAADHGRMWLDSDEREVKIQRGFAIFRVHVETLDLGSALIDATTRAPVGKEVKSRPVYVAKPAWELLVKALGDADVAGSWLRSAVGALGLVPAGNRFVARS